MVEGSLSFPLVFAYDMLMRCEKERVSAKVTNTNSSVPFCVSYYCYC
jgi:hypothetical protein